MSVKSTSELPIIFVCCVFCVLEIKINVLNLMDPIYFTNGNLNLKDMMHFVLENDWWSNVHLGEENVNEFEVGGKNR